MHAGLCAVIFWFHFSIWLVLLNAPMMAWHIKQLMDESFRVDPTKVPLPNPERIFSIRHLVPEVSKPFGGVSTLNHTAKTLSSFLDPRTYALNPKP